MTNKDQNLGGVSPTAVDSVPCSVHTPQLSHDAPTPGPWRVRKGTGNSCLHVVSDNGALHTGCIAFDGRGVANAHLIAAAPDMKAALKRLASAEGFEAIGVIPDTPWGDELRARMAFAEEAIAKAEGR